MVRIRSHALKSLYGALVLLRKLQAVCVEMRIFAVVFVSSVVLDCGHDQILVGMAPQGWVPRVKLGSRGRVHVLCF
jgi:hypothetical protein